MRKYHRWLSVLFGVFILWIAVTGVLSQVGELVNKGGMDDDDRPTAAAAAATPAVPAGFVCPATMNCRPKPATMPGQWNVGFLHHIHSGEQFGPVGVILSILSGLSLIFFAISGMWMYVVMYRRRAHRHSHPRRLFW